MNRLLGTSVVGGVGVGGIRCRPSQYPPLARMVKLVNARSSDECKVCGASHGDRKTMYEDVDFGSIFSSEEKAQKEAGHSKELHYRSVFTGHLKKRYLDYLEKLDWSSMRAHISKFPRGISRSEDEMKVIFEKWASQFGKEFIYESHRNCTYDRIKKKMASIDADNSEGGSMRYGLNQRSARRFG